MGQFNLNHLYACQIVNQRIVGSEADVDDVPPVGDGLPDVGIDKGFENFQIGHPPNHVVAEPDVVEHLVHLWDAGWNAVKCCHVLTPLFQNDCVFFYCITCLTIRRPLFFLLPETRIK